ncbi:MAG: NlpC/P60 family protein [Vulcanimicrobiota bacterium]
MRMHGMWCLLALIFLAIEPVLAQDHYLYYRVNGSDTLASVAKRYGLERGELLAMNPTISQRGGRVVAGDVLCVPDPSQKEPEPYYTYHRVGPTENLTLIAENYGTDRRTLLEMNPTVRSGSIEPGTVLFVPNPEYKPENAQLAYAWEKIKGNPIYKLPEPEVPSPVLAAESPADIQDGLEALPRLSEDPTSEEWNLLTGFGVLGKEIPKFTQHRNLMIFSDHEVIEVPTRGARPHRQALASRRGRRIYGLLRTARSLLGIPYVWGGESVTGADCSGYVQLVYGRSGVRLPRTADIQFEVGRPIRKGKEQPGDLVFFETYAPGASHVGIYVGRHKFLHASSGAKQVTIGSLEDPYFKSRYLGARRHL